MKQKTMSRAVVLAVFLSAGSFASAADRGPLQTVVVSLERTLAAAKSIQFKSTHEVTETDVYQAVTNTPPATGPTGRTAEISFQASGDKYWYSRTLTEADGSGVRSYDRAWDGKYFQVLNHRTNSLLLSRANPDGNHLQLGVFNPLNMFGFLQSQIPGQEPTLSWTALKNLKFWKACLNGAQVLQADNFQGKPCLVALIPGGIYKDFNVPCTYTVYFSKTDGYFPVAWKAIDLTGRLLEDYQVTEFDKAPVGATFFYFPKRAINDCYPPTGFPPDKPMMITTTETTLLSLNTSADDAVFTIDPLRAHEIIDFDNNVVMPVPK